MDLIFAYTRAQAIADGVLIDVTKTAKEAGYTLHTVVTSAVWEHYVRVPDAVSSQDEQGRLWDILWMLRCAILRLNHAESQMTFELLVANEETKPPELVKLKAILGPGDDERNVLTILLPHED
jgi:hypothetical protein